MKSEVYYGMGWPDPALREKKLRQMLDGDALIICFLSIVATVAVVFVLTRCTS